MPRARGEGLQWAQHRVLSGSLPPCCSKVLPQCQELSQPQLVPAAEQLQWGASSVPWGHRELLVGITARTGCPKQGPFLGQGFNGVLGLQPPPLG